MGLSSPNTALNKLPVGCLKIKQQTKGILAAFTCYYRNVGTAELYIYKEKLICKSGDEIFFDLPIQSVESLEYSERNFFLLSARGQEYQLAYLHLPEEGMKKSTYIIPAMEYIDKPATDELVGTLSSLGVNTVLVPHQKVMFIGTRFTKQSTAIIISVIITIAIIYIIALT